MQRLRIGTVELETPLLLAPIAGWCDLAYRLVVRSVRGEHGGVGLACTDLLCPEAILRETDTTAWLASTCADDQPLCMQLYGRDPDVMVQAAHWAQAHGAVTIDINMGCPVDKVTKKNGGSKLLCEPGLAVDIVRRLVGAVRVPVTAKIRLGWDARSLITRTLPVQLADAGAAAITVHGRTTEQKFRGEASLSGIAQVVDAVGRVHPHVPVIGNGDVKSAQDAKRMMNVTGCAGVMIGRGALGQPWLFRDCAHYLATGETPPPLSRAERVRLLLEHIRQLRRLRDDRYAMIKMRGWVSRYSPHVQPWPHLRRNVQAMKGITELVAMLEAGLAQLEQSPTDADPIVEAALAY